jgi:serine protease Do
LNWLPTLITLAVAATSRPAAAPSPPEPNAGESLLRASQVAFRAVAEKVRPALVRIETVGGSQPQGFLPTSEDDSEDEGKPAVPKPFQENLGSGFVVADGPTTGLIYSSDGYIVTSGFNFVRDPLLISVILSDGRRFAAELVARDQVRKIALLKIDAANLPVPTWCDLTEIRVGQWAVALGLGFGGETPSLTAGIVSATNRMLGNAIQTDAKLSPANYGGPVCNLDGRILGIAVPMAQRPGELAGIEMYDSGVGFAVPKQGVDEIVTVLKTGRSFYRGWLGIQIDPRSTEGLLILNVADPSPMQAAGIRPGDKILEANGKPIKHFGHLVQSLYMIPAGEKVYLTMQRESRQFGIAVHLARNTELGPLPVQEEPFDPSKPPVLPPDDD